MNTNIFRKYDIRGIAADDLTDEVVENIGHAYASKMIRELGMAGKVGVGRDARGSSDRLFTALSNGLMRAGVDVLDLGMVPTPLVYFAKFTREDLQGAIMITGSHNPAEYNGFKMMLGAGTLHGEGIEELRDMILDEDLIVATQPGEVESWDGLRASYLDWLEENLSPAGERGRFKVVLDSGNGVAGVVAPEAVRRVFDAEVIELFSEPDASFPNHHPDPTVEENLEHLIAAVREHGADVGVAYDGDGDRIGLVDEKGGVIWGDKLMILLSRDVLSTIPGATIIGEVKCSQTLFDDITAHGGAPIMSAVGHSIIKARIKETGAKLAGEMSGHIFFNDRYFGFDDAVYATCRVLEILSRSRTPLSELLSDVPTTHATPELRVDCDEDRKFVIPSEVAEHFAAQGYEVNTIDGARVNFGKGWGLVRASNTQPVLVLRVEAETPELRDEFLAKLQAAIR
jgi:phosphomannomutase/phosphoglucomutase